MNKMLNLAPNLFIPVNAVTQTFGILGKRGSGKSNAGRVMAEEMFRAGIPYCVVDPVGSWWGLRSARSGKGPGLAIPIFGGDHGDIPLEREAGQLIADLITEQRLSCLLDISYFSENDKAKFLTDFAERLFQRNRDPIHLFLEEADDFIPQRVMGERARLVGAWQRIIKRGRSRGLGATMITQRSAAINKDVLTQCETLLVFRTTSPQDMKAIEGWLQYHGQKTDVLASLPSLSDGECWIWSPHWLGKLARHKIRLSETFDSGATPTDLKGRRTPATLADVDLQTLSQRMAATIQKAKETDPKELRRQINQLQNELRQARDQKQDDFTVENLRLRCNALDSELAILRKERDQITALRRHQSWALTQFVKLADSLSAIIQQARDQAVPETAPIPKANAAPVTKNRALREQYSSRQNAADQRHPDQSGNPIGKGERIILTAIAQYGDQGVTRAQLTVLTGYKRSSRDTYLQRLSSQGLIELRDGAIAVTELGLGVLGDRFEPLPTGAALRDYWLRELPEGERRLFALIIEVYPHPVDREELSKHSNYKRSSRDTYIQRLRSRQLVIEAGSGLVQASPTLFQE
jgi:hypothetical protein